MKLQLNLFLTKLNLFSLKIDLIAIFHKIDFLLIFIFKPQNE